MLILKSYKLRLYPNKGQQVFFNKTFGACRVIYNEMLYNLQENYKNGIKKDKYKLFKDIKSKYEWMKEVDSNALCSNCGHKMSNMGLEIRQWICPICGVQHDRDINAAINIKNEGLRILDTIGIEQTEFKPLENITMDDKLAITLKSSDSMN